MHSFISISSQFSPIPGVVNKGTIGPGALVERLIVVSGLVGLLLDGDSVVGVFLEIGVNCSVWSFVDVSGAGVDGVFLTDGINIDVIKDGGVVTGDVISDVICDVICDVTWGVNFEVTGGVNLVSIVDCLGIVDGIVDAIVDTSGIDGTSDVDG